MAKKKCVLFIEDELELAEEVVELLEYSNIKVVHVVDYTDAISKAANQVFDLIIADIHLKRGTGDKVIKTIRATSRHLNYKTPIMVASSHVTRELMFEIREHLYHAMVKPYKLTEFLDKTLEVLEA